MGNVTSKGPGGIHGISDGVNSFKAIGKTIEFDSSDNSIEVTADVVNKKLDLKVSSTHLWIKGSSLVPTSSMVVVDTLVLNSFRFLKYIVTAWNDTEEKVKGFEMSIVKKNDTTLSTTVHGILGGGISLVTEPVVNGSNMELRIQNNSSFTVSLEFARLKLGS